MVIMRLEEAVGTMPISDEQSYVSDMGKSYIDKLFFMDKVDPDVIVDFGCADGYILSKISKLRPKVKLVGYDLDPEMLAKARARLPGRAVLTGDWKKVEAIARRSDRAMLLLSSVVHEVYSYSRPAQVRAFWQDQVFGGLFEWVCLRDMVPAEPAYTGSFSRDVAAVRSKVPAEYIRSFEAKFGKISQSYRAFIHFLLKYRYVENWEREVNENYVPVSLKTLKGKIPSGYRVTYEDSYVYDFFRMQVKQDLGIDIRQTTHTKMIIQRR